jgi:hypothetical protein
VPRINVQDILLKMREETARINTDEATIRAHKD